MSVKGFLSQFFAYYKVRQILKKADQPVKKQLEILKELIKKATPTEFGREHHFNKINSYEEFKKRVPLSDYEAIRPYIEKIKAGKKNILWPGRPLYFSKTSGTTSGSKYIPLTKRGIKHQIEAARDTLLFFINQTKKTDFIDGKMIFIQGSPELTHEFKVPSGRLSGLVAYHIPSFLRKNRLPSFKTNCIDNWEKKMDAIIEETRYQNMTLISGIPPWVIDYFERLLIKTEKETIIELFPNLQLLIFGGVNFMPYRTKINKLIGKTLPILDVYPASEGFIAFQYKKNSEGMLLNLNAGIFYEFIESKEINNPDTQRLSIKEVKINVPYALILNTDSGLWGYKIGDIVEFISLNPPEIKMIGRSTQFISTFGEHVIAEEVDYCINILNQKLNINITEFHVAPFVATNKNEFSFHEWFLETENNEVLIETISERIDKLLQRKNSYYQDLREGKMLSLPKVNFVPKGSFKKLLDSLGKFGGQNKPPRLANNRELADALNQFL